jgi:hypothetical protein
MHTHISGLEGLKIALYVIVVMGTLNLVAINYKDKSGLAASYANLFGLS